MCEQVVPGDILGVQAQPACQSHVKMGFWAEFENFHLEYDLKL